MIYGDKMVPKPVAVKYIPELKRLAYEPEEPHLFQDGSKNAGATDPEHIKEARGLIRWARGTIAVGAVGAAAVCAGIPINIEGLSALGTSFIFFGSVVTLASIPAYLNVRESQERFPRRMKELRRMANTDAESPALSEARKEVDKITNEVCPGLAAYQSEQAQALLQTKRDLKT